MLQTALVAWHATRCSGSQRQPAAVGELSNRRMVTEVWHDFGEDAPVMLIPVADGRLEVTAGGEVLFDRKAEGGVYPEMRRVRDIKKRIAQMLEARI